MQEIYIKKLQVAPGGAEARDLDVHLKSCYRNDGFSVPVGLTIEGELNAPIVVGEPVTVLRHKRNGVPRGGLFMTTRVLEMGEGTFRTANSIYKYHFIQ